MWVYFILHKDDIWWVSERFLADRCMDGVPEIIRSDGEDFGDPCNRDRIKWEFATPSTSHLNGCAEPGLTMLEVARIAARFCAASLFDDIKMLNSIDNLWDEAMNWACDSLHRTATTTNPGSKSPYRM